MADARDSTTLWLKQAAQMADRTGEAACGRFLPVAEKALALTVAHQYGLTASFDGGWPDAERVQVCFHPQGAEPVFTALWLEIRWDARFAQLAHHDLLGSLMGLGIDRSHTGDLVLQGGDEPCAMLYVLPVMASLLEREWAEAGRTALLVRRPEAPPVIQPEPGVMSSATVPSLRLDAVVAASLHLSRARAAELIRAELVQVNHIPQARTDCVLREGDLISVRGYGRVRLREVGSPTRKDRLPVRVEQWRR